MRAWETTKGTKISIIVSGRCNVFCVEKEGAAVLIDASTERNYAPILSALQNRNISKINALVLTHTHFDHTENTARIKEKFHPEIIVHSSESVFLITGDSPLPRGSFFLTKVLTKLFAKRVRALFSYKGCNCDVLVDSYFDLAGFGINAYLMHTPGHTRGSMCLIVDHEIAIVGDTLYGVLPYNVLPPFAENKKQLVDSWKKLLNTGCQVFLPSHGKEISRSLLQKSYNKHIKAFQ